MVIADNVRSHKVAGATLRDLPPYSPDLSPIEKLFSKLKTLLRNAAKRSVDALWNEIGQLLQRFSPEECTNNFQSSGYHVWLNRKNSNARISLSANNTSEDEKPSCVGSINLTFIII